MAGEDRRKREPTPGELAWQKRRAESTAAYNMRKAEREERRAANTDDPDRAAAAHRAAEMYRARIPTADKGAAAPAAGRNPGVGNGAPAGGGGNGNNEALQAFVADIANLRAEVNQLRGELAALKGRKTFTIKFGEDERGGSGSLDVVTHTEYDTTTHTFKQYKRTIVGITVKEATNEQNAGETVFVTTPISSELLN